MSHVPYRTGIPSILLYLRLICRLLVTFRPVVGGFLTVEQLVFWDALLDACEAFRENVPNPRPRDEVD